MPYTVHESVRTGSVQGDGVFPRVVQKNFDFLLIGLKDAVRCADNENMRENVFEGVCDSAHAQNICSK